MLGLNINVSSKKTVFGWLRLLLITGGAQVFVNATAVLSGFLIVRLLSVEEYAYYTIANTMLSTMVLLADGGVSVGVMSEGGKVWENKEKLGTVLKTGIFLRKKFSIYSLLVTIPILIYLLHDHDASLLTCILVSIAIIPAFIASITDTIYQVPIKLHQDVKRLQLNQFLVSIGRFILTVSLLFLYPVTFLAVLANGIPRSIGNLNLRHISSSFVVPLHDVKLDEEVKNSVLKVVRRVMPTTIYYCISGQLNIFLLSFLGSTASLASFGALGRVSAATAIFTTMISTLLVPRFARLKNIRGEIVKTFLLYQLAIIAACAGFIVFIYLLSNQILWLLGDDYLGLNYELVLISISSCLTVISSSTNNLMSSRSIILSPVFLICTTLIVQIGGVFIFNVSTISGVVYYGIATVFVLYLLRLAFFFYVIKKNKF